VAETVKINKLRTMSKKDWKRESKKTNKQTNKEMTIILHGSTTQKTALNIKYGEEKKTRKR
jgi:hypothetical protein